VWAGPHVAKRRLRHLALLRQWLANNSQLTVSSRARRRQQHCHLSTVVGSTCQALPCQQHRNRHQQNLRRVQRHQRQLRPRAALAGSRCG
jgi:hypothetical protein